MLHQLFIAAVKPTLARSIRRWIYRLGALGFIPLGLLDASIIPIPGSMDVLTIILSSRNEQMWLYYALMATLGSVMGAFATYRLARKGGKEMLERRFPRRPLNRAFAAFEKWGFGAIAVPALLPPPIPMVPFVLAAGAMQYSWEKFLAAITLGRIVRYSLLAYLAAHYGRGIRTFVEQHGHPFLMAVIGLAITALAGYFVLSLIRRQGPARV